MSIRPLLSRLPRYIGTGLAAIVLCAPAWSDSERKEDGSAAIKHVLLISVDGMHEVDLQNYVAAHPASAFAKLISRGAHYTQAHTSTPSDSFPGLMAFMTGGSPLSHGIFYDDSYDRTLFPPGSNCKGTPGTEANYAENIDVDLTQLSGGGATGSNHIDPTR
jgi:hypothetical protein